MLSNINHFFITKIILSVLILLLGVSCLSAKQTEAELKPDVSDSSQDYKKPDEPALSVSENSPAQNDEPERIAFISIKEPESKEKLPKFFENDFAKKITDEKVIKEIKDDDDDKDDSQIEGKEKFHWKPALIQSGIFLGIQHGFRMTQQKTLRELDGPFFRDWGKSVKGLRGWQDSDNLFTNYVAHPLQGGLTGRIFINNSDVAKRQEFGKSKEYWQSRFKAFVWSAAWSTQFELGPISEASLGNVGIRDKNGFSTMAYTDLVVTPTLGTGVLIGEDAIDKYVLKNWLERKRGNQVTTTIKVLRSVLTPTTAFSNLLRGKAPWKRDNR